MARRKKQSSVPSQAELLDISAKLRTAPCVRALREALKAWRAGGYKGIADTTRVLLNHWFETDHDLSRSACQGRKYRRTGGVAQTLFVMWERAGG